MTNPGLEALWEDERIRRHEMNLADVEPLTPPSSPPRDKDSNFATESQKFWEDRFAEALEKLKNQGLIRTASSAQSSSDPDCTANFAPSKDKEKAEKRVDTYVYATEAAEDCVLPDATILEEHVPSISQSLAGSFFSKHTMMIVTTANFASTFFFGILSGSQGTNTRRILNIRRTSEVEKSQEDHNKENYFNQTLVDVDILSQSLSSQRLSMDEDEEELVNLLGELNNEKLEENQNDPSQDKTKTTPEKETIVPELNQPRENYLDRLDDLEMSQIILDSDPFLAMDDDFESIAKSFATGATGTISQKEKEIKKSQAAIDASLDWDSDSFLSQLELEED